MSLEEQLQPASFKGVSFYVTAATVTGGRKDIKHSFPNSNRQTIEDLGLAPRVFNITAVISGDDTYVQDRDRLIAALEEGGPGILIHPFYGQLNNYVARTYTLAEDLTTLGEARFTIVFEISDSTGLPVQSQNTLSIIDTANQNVVAGVQEDITGTYNVTPGFLGNFQAAKDKINEGITAFNENTSVLQADAAQINAFNQELNEFSNNINSLVKNPSELATSITNLYNTVDSLYASVESTAAVLAGFFDFGDDDTPITPTTAGLVERKTNNNVLNSAMQSLALSYAYFNTAQVTFETVEQIDEAASELEKQYRKVIKAEGLSDATKDELTNLRTELQSFFNSQRTIARQIIEVDTNKTSARLLSYQYYGDSSEGETILELNNVKQDVNFIEGTVKILTA